MADNYNSSYDDFWGQYANGNSDILTLIQQQLHSVTIGTNQLADGAVTADQLANGSIKEAHFTDLSVSNAAIQNLAVTQEKVANSAIGNAQIDRASVNKLVVDTADIKDAAITNAKIDLASVNRLIVGSANIGIATIQDAHIDRESANKVQIIDGDIVNVSASKLNVGTLDTSKVIVQGNNGNLKIQNNRLQIFDNQATPIERISLGDVNDDGTVYGLRVRSADGQTVLYDQDGVYNEGITNGAITNPKISDDAVDGRTIAAQSVTADHMVTGTITAASGVIHDIDASVIRSGKIDAQFVTVGLNSTFDDGYDPTKIQVGGTNLLTGTKDYSGWTKFSASVNLDTVNTYNGFVVQKQWADWNYYCKPYTFTANKEYTVSVYLKADVGGVLNPFFTSSETSSGGANLHNLVSENGDKKVTTSWQRYSVTFSIPSTDTTLSNGVRIESSGFSNGNVIYVAGLKIEEGNKATDWSPNPSDPAQDTLNVNGTPASTVVSNAANGNTAHGWFRSDGTLDVTKLYGTLTDAQIASAAKWNGQGTYIDQNGIYTGNLVASQIVSGTISADRIKVGVGTSFDSGYDPTKIQIGGTNLILNSNFYYGLNSWANWGTATRTIETINSKTYVHLVDSGTGTYRGISQGNIPAESGTDYMISFTAYASSGQGNIGIHEKLGGTIVTQTWWSTIALTSTPTRYAYKFTTTSSNIDNFNLMVGGTNGAPFNVYFADLKIEKGNKVSYYSPSPQDNPSLAWKYTGTTEIDGGSIHADTITAVQIAANTITANEIKSLNGLNVGNGQFVVDGSGNVTIGGTLNGADGTFTGRVNILGTDYYNVDINNGSIKCWTNENTSYSLLTGNLLQFGSGGSNDAIATFSGDGNNMMVSFSSNVGVGTFGVGGYVEANSGYNNLGKKPAYTWTGTIGVNSSITLTHNLGYKPIISHGGTVGNAIPTFEYTSTTQLRIYNYTTGGNSWTGTINLW